MVLPSPVGESVAANFIVAPLLSRFCQRPSRGVLRLVRKLLNILILFINQCYIFHFNTPPPKKLDGLEVVMHL